MILIRKYEEILEGLWRFCEERKYLRNGWNLLVVSRFEAIVADGLTDVISRGDLWRKYFLGLVVIWEIELAIYSRHVKL
tara:strand:+ start:202 stop:438 length:237 start_codon:yes stop_codon:yes gene_type:complete